MPSDIIKIFIENNNLIPFGSTIIIGLSGGPDSVFLVHVLVQMRKELNLTLIAAHLDHGWRVESAQDRIWCQALCEQLGVSFIHGHATAFEHLVRLRGSKEDVGRQMRRLFFEQIAQKHAAHHIALAHHADDQQETFFIRLLRGAHLSGLCGIQPQSGLYIRPLLKTKKQDILAFLEQHKISYLHDSSNDSDQFLRNRIRHKVLPALRATDERFDHQFSCLQENLQEAEDFLEDVTRQAMHRVLVNDKQTAKLSLGHFRQESSFMQRRILLQWLIENKISLQPSRALLNEILRFLLHQNPTGIHTISPHLTLYKKSGYVSLQ